MEKNRQDQANERQRSSAGQDPRRDRMDPNRPQPGREQPMRDPQRDPRDEPRHDPARRERRESEPQHRPEEPMDDRSD